MELGALLRHHRQRAGLTQEGLAERASLSTQAISALERGTRLRPRRRTIDHIAAALDLSRTQHEQLISAAYLGWARGRRPVRALGGDTGIRRVPFGALAELRLVNVGDQIPSGAVVLGLLVKIDSPSQHGGEEPLRLVGEIDPWYDAYVS